MLLALSRLALHHTLHYKFSLRIRIPPSPVPNPDQGDGKSGIGAPFTWGRGSPIPTCSEFPYRHAAECFEVSAPAWSMELRSASIGHTVHGYIHIFMGA